MTKNSASNDSILNELRSIGLDDEQIILIFGNASSSYGQTAKGLFEFTITEINDGMNSNALLAKISLSNRSKIEKIEFGKLLQSESEQRKFVNAISNWFSGQNGHLVLLRPLFARLPLLGKFQWRDSFQIRPVGPNAKIGKGLNFHNLATSQLHGEPHLGPPYPFVLEVKANKSEDISLGHLQGYRRLTEYESLLSVLLIQHILTPRTLSEKRWTSIWNGSEISYHILSGGFDFGEDGLRDDFSAGDISNVTLFSGDDYYNHLFVRDREILLPPNINELLAAFDELQKPERSAFLRACYWFSLAIENQRESALSVVAFSTAIECLLPRPSAVSCDTCGKPTGKGPTKLFNEHLEKYAPILPALENRRAQIYNLRSALVHGSKLEAIDLDWLSPLRSDDDAMLLEFIARRCLVNWLADPDRLDPTLS